MSYNNFCAGFMSGISQAIIGHPLDTLKILKQNTVKINRLSMTNLYKGVSMPLIQTPFVVGVGFYVNETIKKYTGNQFVSGFASGAVGSFLICPFEYYKIHLQQQEKVIINSKYWLKSYRHINFVLLREVPAMTLYFGIYGKLRDNKVSPFLSGGISGLASWIFTYPLDTIKTRVQGGVSSNIKNAIKMGNLWCGISYCLIRAFIVNGVGFSVYEYIC